MEIKPKLSIIVPVYNTEKYLERCLNSILSQSYDNLEIIIVNDCSPDKSADIIGKYAKKDPRVKCITHEKNQGLFLARMTGADQATGEYLAFVDSDDYLSVDYYRELMQYAIKESCDIVAGNTVRDLGDGNLIQYTLHKICFGDQKLCGDEVREHFYAQEGSCYAWHTVWNKIYRKTLWDHCAPEYRKIVQHLIMTEDIAFSSVLFYYAQSFGYVNTDSSCYYYCVNNEAATNTQNISFPKFRKNVQDLILVFNFVETFLSSVGASDEICMHFRNFRSRYYQIWKKIQLNEFMLGENSVQAKKLIAVLGVGVETTKPVELPSFESLESVWYSEIEKIRLQIVRDSIEIVSFDIFDTLLLRPFWNPDDLFTLMQKQFEEICPHLRNLSFKTLRQFAEKKARSEIGRAHPQFQDVTLDEIYLELQASFKIPAECAKQLQKCEEQMELAFTRARKTAKLLFEFAQSCGKRVILVSDMYLNIETIKAMLFKNGYNNYERLFLSSQDRVTKYSGKLFDLVLSELNVAPDHILHIGDNWEHDICMAKSKGFKTGFLPKTKDRFCNTVHSAPTNSLAAIGCLAGGQLTTWEKLYTSIGYRSMAALAANKFFDNPYASWNPNTDFDSNPYAMGYYAVGMHLVGITKWIADITKRRRINRICFLARDGYLPMMALDALKTFFDIENIMSSYVPCSRMCLMPWIIEDEQGLYALPVEYRYHTPLSLLTLLENYFPRRSEDDLIDMVKEAGFEPGACFAEENEYYLFITWFKDNLFCRELLEVEKRKVSAYYREQIPTGSLVFDLGYSGRILSALQKALQYTVTFAYIHEDGKTFQTFCRRDDLDVEVMYDFVPPLSDLIREYFLSEVGNSCVGLKKENGEIIPQYKDSTIPYDERYIPQKIMEGASQFISDFCDTFSSVKDLLYFNPINISMPFEGLLHSSTFADRNVLSLSYSDDTVYGRNDRISMAHFWHTQPSTCSVRGCAGDQFSYLKMILDGKGKVSKLIIYWICDRATLKMKIKDKLVLHPVLLLGMRKVYRMLKNLWYKLKG